MHVKYVKVVNAGPFAEFETDLRFGSVGIFGSNGSGKTTLMRLVHAALTRRFNMFPGVKADLPFSSAASRSDSYVEVHAEHAGVVFETTLSFRERKTGPGRSRLKVHGEKELTSEPEIVARMAQLGLSPAVVDFSVFVYGVYDFIDLTPSKRAEVYRTLCGTERAQQAHKCLTAVLNSAVAAEVTVIDNSDQIAAAIGEAELELARLEGLKKRIDERLTDARFARASRYVLRAARYERLAADRDHLEALLTDLVRRQKKAESGADQLSSRLVDVDRAVAKGKRASAEAEQALREADERMERNQMRQRLRDDIQRFSKKLPKPEGDSDGSSVQELAASLQRLELKYEQAQASLALLSDDNGGRCPTCGQSLIVSGEHIAEHAERERERIESLQEEMDLLRARIERQRQYEQKMAEWTEKSRQRSANLKSSTKALDALGQDELVDVDGETMRTAIKEQVKLVELQTQLREKLGRARVRAAELSGQRRRVEKQRDKLASNKVLAAGPVDAAKIPVAKRLGEIKLRLQNRSQRLVGMIGVVRKTLATRRNELAQVRRQAAQSHTRRRLRAVYSRAADLLHWDGLPRKVASKTLARMTRLINDNLLRLGGPFTVAATDDMSFDCTIGDLSPRDMVWLSSGQRVLLALSFWSAASVFAASPGLLVLDEPTANLDAANIDYLGGALTLLSNNVRGTRQVIMTTHADGLRASFDQVIEL